MMNGIEIRSNDGKYFTLYPAILVHRWAFFRNERQLAIQKISCLSSEEINSILEYLYAGLPAIDRMKHAFSEARVIFPSGDTLYQLKQDMTKLFKTHNDSDFKILSHGQSFFVHRFILAIRSEFFSGLFKSSLKECETGIMEDIFSDSASHFSQFLEYLYTGSGSFKTVNDLFELLKLSKPNFYGIIEGHEGEVEEFIVAEIIKNHNKEINEIKQRAQIEKYTKLLSLINSCNLDI